MIQLQAETFRQRRVAAHGEEKQLSERSRKGTSMAPSAPKRRQVPLKRAFGGATSASEKLGNQAIRG